MKRLSFAAIFVIATLFYCHSCYRDNKKEHIFSYGNLQDSLECFISKEPDLPANMSTFVCVIFHAGFLEEREDTIVVLMKGNGPFLPVNGQKVIGATYFKKHICEMVYDGFEHLPAIVNEDILTLKEDDYIHYGYDKEIHNESQYINWHFTSEIKNLKKMLTRTYRINRPNNLERIQ